MDEKQIEAKMANISRGAYWFGILGRLSVFIGCLAFFPGIFLCASALLKGGVSFDELGIKLLVGSIQPLISGWLFLLGRDAFEAIDFVLKETRDTV